MCTYAAAHFCVAVPSAGELGKLPFPASHYNKNHKHFKVKSGHNNSAAVVLADICVIHFLLRII